MEFGSPRVYCKYMIRLVKYCNLRPSTFLKDGVCVATEGKASFMARGCPKGKVVHITIFLTSTRMLYNMFYVFDVQFKEQKKFIALIFFLILTAKIQVCQCIITIHDSQYQGILYVEPAWKMLRYFLFWRRGLI